MVSPLESSTSVLLSLALDAAVMRQQAAAQNIANANTPGYRPVSVSFESRMSAERETLARGEKLTLPSSQSALAYYRPTLMTSTVENEAVALDKQVADLAGITLQQQVLLRAVTKHFSLLNLAISEGKR
jgi:flagellar basal-body rod protein FlgB